MENFVTVFKYMKWDGTKYVILGWATETAIKMFEAFKLADCFQQVELSRLDEYGRLLDS